MASQHAAQIGARIRERRKEMGLKQRQLADLIPSDAIDNQRISDWERGVNAPVARNMEMLAKALERPIAWFHEQDSKPEEAAPDLMDALAGTPSQLDRIETKLDEILQRLETANIKPLSPGQIAKMAADRADARKTQAPQDRRGTRKTSRAA